VIERKGGTGVGRWEGLQSKGMSYWVKDRESCGCRGPPAHTATHCNTLQYTAKYCNTLQHTAIHCNNLQHVLFEVLQRTLQHTAIHCNTLQHTATHSNTLQYPATPCNMLRGLRQRKVGSVRCRWTMKAGG